LSALDVDLVIVGGGPAGLSTALFLASQDKRLAERTWVLERSTYPREKVCAGAIGARADRLLATIGVCVDVPQMPIRGLAVEASRRSLVVRHEGAPIGRVVRRVEFDDALRRAAQARGVRVLEGVKVASVSVEEGAARLVTSRGEIVTRAVVGADGVGSVVRRSLGLPKGAFLAQAVEVDTPFVETDHGPDILGFDLKERALPGYGWDFPTIVADEPMVCRGIYELWAEGVPERAQDEPAPAERLLRRLEKLGVKAAARGLRRFAERGLSLNEPFARPRVLLVGEAAGIDPALGEGIAQAIHYGAVAGPYLAKAFGAGDFSFASFPKELQKTRLGLDLLVRSRAAKLVYGKTRPLVERWVTSSPALAKAGMTYFAGERAPRQALARAAWDLACAGFSLTLERLT